VPCGTVHDRPSVCLSPRSIWPGAACVCFSAVEVELGTASCRAELYTTARLSVCHRDLFGPEQPAMDNRAAPSHDPHGAVAMPARPHDHPNPVGPHGLTREAVCPHSAPPASRSVRNTPGTGRTVLVHATAAASSQRPDQQQ
jgi:hypothetical protein